MGWSRIKLDELLNSIQSGRKSIGQGSKAVTFASLDEMMRIYKEGTAELDRIDAGASSNKSRIVKLTQTGTGLQ